MRQVLKEILATDPDIEVVAVAMDGEDALKKIEFYPPQVITLDLKMPRMDGLAFLSQIMKKNPLPVVIVSSWAREDSEETLQALELGAVRSEEHTSELQSRPHLVCRLLLEKKKKKRVRQNKKKKKNNLNTNQEIIHEYAAITIHAD